MNRFSVLAASVAVLVLASSLVAQPPLPPLLPAPYAVYLGPGCGNPPPALDVTAPIMGETAVFTFDTEFPSCPAYVFVSLPTWNFLEILPGYFIYLDIWSATLLSVFPTDNLGDCVFPLYIPDVPVLTGMELNLQAFVSAPGGPSGPGHRPPNVTLDHASNGIGIRIDGCGPCVGKVDTLRLQYMGSLANALVEVKQKQDQAVVFLGTVQPGEMFDILGTLNGTLGTEIEIRVNGGGATKVHTSCSQPIGPGMRFGDFVVVAGTSNIGGPLCPGQTCDRGNPCRIIMRYTGDGCAASSHGQDPMAVICNGDPAMAPTVYIRATEKSDPFDTTGDIWFEGAVNLGEAFALEAAAANALTIGSPAYVHVLDPTGGFLQTVAFDTSCTEPLAIFDQFGSVRVEQFFAMGECGAQDLCAGGSKPALLTMQYTGQSCAATSHYQDPTLVACSGDPALAPTVLIRASDKAPPNHTGANVWFQGTVNLNETFDIDAANAGVTKLGGTTFVHIFDSSGTTLLQQVQFDTSCAQPLVVDDQFGALKLLGLIPE